MTIRLYSSKNSPILALLFAYLTFGALQVNKTKSIIVYTIYCFIIFSKLLVIAWFDKNETKPTEIVKTKEVVIVIDYVVKVEYESSKIVSNTHKIDEYP